MLLLVGWVPLLSEWASLVAQTVKNLPAMQETQVQSLPSPAANIIASIVLLFFCYFVFYTNVINAL